MKETVSILVLMSFVSLWAQIPRLEERTEYNQGYIDGKVEGSKKDQMGWMAGSCGAGLLAPCLGSGIVWIAAGSDMPEYVPGEGTEYKMGFVEGYKISSKDKKRNAAIMGGLVGLGINVALIILIVSAD